MVLFPNGKINLGLRVKAKRADGFHDIETVFYPILLKEALELTPQPLKHADNPFDLVITGRQIPGDPASNLCLKAYQLISKDYQIDQPLRMHLHKLIPTGSGLGGGSADGAIALKLINEELKLNISAEKLMEYALQLGSDCPFFLINTPCLATGRGEMLKEIRVELDKYYFVLVFPDIAISTAWAYSKTTPSDQQQPIEAVINTPVSAWKGKLTNDFEPVVFDAYPAIGMIRDELYAAGAVYASLTGTGSCVYGLFHQETHCHLKNISPTCQVYHLKPNT